MQTDTSRQPSLNFDLPSANAETSWRCRAGSIALRLEGDIVFYALGTGEYDELNCKCEISVVSAMLVLRNSTAFHWMLAAASLYRSME